MAGLATRCAAGETVVATVAVLSARLASPLPASATTVFVAVRGSFPVAETRAVTVRSNDAPIGRPDSAHLTVVAPLMPKHAVGVVASKETTVAPAGRVSVIWTPLPSLRPWFLTV